VNLMLYQDELKMLAQKMKIESSTLLPCISSLFEGTDYVSATKKSYAPIENLQLSLLGATTIDSYQSMCDSSMKDMGLINRLWIVPGESMSKYPIPKPIRDEDLIHIRERLVLMVSKAKDGKKLSLTEDAEQVFNEWYLNREKSSHAIRLETYAHRLMCILAINDGKDCIGSDIISRVIALCNWQLEVRKIYDPLDTDSIYAKVEDLIRRALNRCGSLTVGRLRKVIHAERYGVRVFQYALSNLIEIGDVLRKDDAYCLV